MSTQDVLLKPQNGFSNRSQILGRVELPGDPWDRNQIHPDINESVGLGQMLKEDRVQRTNMGVVEPERGSTNSKV